MSVLRTLFNVLRTLFKVFLSRARAPKQTHRLGFGVLAVEIGALERAVSFRHDSEGMNCPADESRWPPGGQDRPQPRSHTGPWIKFSITLLGLKGTVWEDLAFVISDTPISRNNNEQITARAGNYFCRSAMRFLFKRPGQDQVPIVTRITYIL